MTFKYIAQPSATEADIKMVQTKLEDRFNNDITFHLSATNEIQKTHRGKMRYLVQELDIKYSLNE